MQKPRTRRDSRELDKEPCRELLVDNYGAHSHWFVVGSRRLYLLYVLSYIQLESFGVVVEDEAMAGV